MLSYVKLSEYPKRNELLDDFVSIVTSFYGRIYGSKRKEKTMRIIENIKSEEK